MKRGRRPDAVMTLPSDEMFTPPELFEGMGITFDLDVAAPPGGVPWVPALHHYTQEDNGLEQPWWGCVWMNPPYTRSGPWVDRFIEHGHGIALLPHSRGRWHGLLWRAADAIACPNEPGRPMFQFVRSSDGKRANIYMPVFLAAMGEDCVEAIGRVAHVLRPAA